MTRGTALLLVLLVACDSSPPPKTSSGMRLERITFQETFALNPEGKSKSLDGDDLRRAIPVLEKHGIFELVGQQLSAKDVVEQGTLAIVVKPVDQPARQLVVKSCQNEKVCGFFADAAAAGLPLRRPVVCSPSAPPCGK